jgi:hypothetical protein
MQTQTSPPISLQFNFLHIHQCLNPSGSQGHSQAQYGQRMLLAWLVFLSLRQRKQPRYVNTIAIKRLGTCQTYATDILDLNYDISMTLPKRCSFRDKRDVLEGSSKHLDCPLPPSYIVSVTDNEEEYMIAVVCQDHRDQMEKWLKALQSLRKIPLGKTKFQDINLIVTDCIHDKTDNSSCSD